MSLITTAAATSVSPTVNLFTHGHKKGGHNGNDGTASSSTQGAATTQSLLSSLFESIEQVIGVSLTAPHNAASAAAPAAGTPTTAARTAPANSSTRMGAVINTTA